MKVFFLTAAAPFHSVVPQWCRSPHRPSQDLAMRHPKSARVRLARTSPADVRRSVARFWRRPLLHGCSWSLQGGGREADTSLSATQTGAFVAGSGHVLACFNHRFV